MDNRLDSLFSALADPTRRAVIARLGAGEAPVGALAEHHAMALPSFLKHVRHLERAGLVATRKEGRQRICTLLPGALAEAEGWIDRQRRMAAAFDRLDALALSLPPAAPEGPGKEPDTTADRPPDAARTRT